jgi:hypothetical protein
MHNIEIKNKEKYQKDLRFVLNTVCAGGAAIFKGLEDDNILVQGYQIVSHGAYYRLQHETGVA